MTAPAPSRDALDLAAVGEEMHALAAELFPLHRSLTGPGLRRTLEVLGRSLPLEVHEVPTGTAMFDWEAPPEWTLRDAYVADVDGRRVIDARASNLEVVAYSRPVRARMTWARLRDRVHTLPDRPDWTPYRTAYFDDTWGFCLPYRRVLELDREPEREYEVLIDATIAPGSLSYGEVVLPGESEDVALVWAHACHPSMANDNLSGVVVAERLARDLAARRRHWTYRIVFAPATVGAIAWLWENRSAARRVRHGMVLAGVGDPGRLTWKRTRNGDAAIDRAAAHVLAHSGAAFEVRDFEPTGYDERQFGSPGFDLPVGRLSRSPHGEYPEYHTSGDDLDFVRPRALAGAWSAALAILDVLEGDRVIRGTRPFGEPRLGPRGLYAAWGRAGDERARNALLWVLNLADGRHTLLDAARRANVPFALVREAADVLIRHGLLEESRRSDTPIRTREEAE